VKIWVVSKAKITAEVYIQQRHTVTAEILAILWHARVRVTSHMPHVTAQAIINPITVVYAVRSTRSHIGIILDRAPSYPLSIRMTSRYQECHYRSTASCLFNLSISSCRHFRSLHFVGSLPHTAAIPLVTNSPVVAVSF
jgi:hypothetical protein